jgi:hypothetical protein
MARGVRLGNPQLAKAAKLGVAAVRANARFAANVLPIIFFWKMGVLGRNCRFHRAVFGLFGDTDLDITGDIVRVK